MKAILVTFFDIKILSIFNSFHKAKQSTKINVEILKRLREVEREERPELWPKD
jgi:hypothetical protein